MNGLMITVKMGWQRAHGFMRRRSMTVLVGMIIVAALTTVLMAMKPMP